MNWFYWILFYIASYIWKVGGFVIGILRIIFRGLKQLILRKEI